jgi:hypothetical protein
MPLLLLVFDKRNWTRLSGSSQFLCLITTSTTNLDRIN